VHQTVIDIRAGNLIPALVVGNGIWLNCAWKRCQATSTGYKVVGVAVNDGEDCKQVHGVPVLGFFSHLPSIIKEHGIEEVLITDSRIIQRSFLETIMRCGRGRNVDFRVLPDLFNCLPKKTEIQHWDHCR